MVEFIAIGERTRHLARQGQRCMTGPEVMCWHADVERWPRSCQRAIPSSIMQVTVAYVPRDEAAVEASCHLGIVGANLRDQGCHPAKPGVVS